MRAGLAFSIILLLATMVLAASGSVVKQVREGIAHFKSGEFNEADKAFEAAQKEAPDNPRVAFDRGCSLAARGEIDDAVDQFRQAALARDHDLAVQSHYNLGAIRGAQAKSLFGERPEDATPDVRQQGLDLLAQAALHYRDCLALENGHAKARHNLEVIRLWIKHMQDIWKERDRQKARQELGLLEFLEMIDQQQRGLRSISRTTEHLPRSMQRQETLKRIADDQQSLSEEIGPLKDKIDAALHPPTAGPPTKQPGAADDPQKQAERLLNEWADDARSGMEQAAGALASDVIHDAVESQNKVLQALDRIYFALAPFQHLLQKATRTEQHVVDATISLTDVKDQDEPAIDDAGVFDLEEDQTRVARWSEVLPHKAKESLAPLQQSAAAAPPSAGDPQQPPPSAPPDPKQRQALETAMNKAIELAPQIHSLATEAAQLVGQKQFSDALPKEEEALKLLKSIVDELPKQEPQQNQQPQDQNDDNKKQKEQDKNDSKKQDQPSEKKDQEKQQEQRSKPKPQQLSKQQAQVLLRKARERERQHREHKKAVRALLLDREKVSKDW